MITLHPEIQAQAHAELDRVVGQENWPTPEDGSRLPYIRAIIKEVGAVIPIMVALKMRVFATGSTHTRAVLDPSPTLLHR